MDAGAPGRTRTGSLLFRRCLGLDAVPEREVPGRQRPWSESYPLVLATVLSRPSPPVLPHHQRPAPVGPLIALWSPSTPAGLYHLRQLQHMQEASG